MPDLITADMVGKTIPEVQEELRQAMEIKVAEDSKKPPACIKCLKIYNEKLALEKEAE